MVEDIIEQQSNEIIVPAIKEELNEIDRERILKAWRKTLSYYSLHPEDFKFRFSNL
jgi:uncharacterized protein (DUF433 family)